MFESESNLGREEIRNNLHRIRIAEKAKGECLSKEKGELKRIIRGDL